jgi:hypothetical protein
MARATIAAGLRRLEDLGLLGRIKRHVRALWVNGGQTSRQATSAYVLHAPRANTALSRDWGCEAGRRYFQAGFPVEVETTWPGS